MSHERQEAPRRVVMLTPGLDGQDGVSRVAGQALRALQDSGMNVEVWSRTAAAPALSSEKTTIRTSSGKLPFLKWGLQRGFSNGRDVLVIAMHVHLAPVALPLISRGARMAIFLHGIEVWKKLSALRTLAMRKASLLISNSAYTVKRFHEANPSFSGRAVTVCALGVPAAEPAAGASDGEPFALMTGRMMSAERYKGHDLLLELWPRLLQSVPAAKLLVAGDGDDRVRLEQKAKSLGLAGAIRFAGRVSDGELNRLYRDCSFFAMPSRNEGFGLVFVEAMRAGKACIGAVGAAEEVIAHDATGLIVNPDDGGDVLRALLRLWREPETRARMGRAGRELFSSKFTEQHFQKRFLAALNLL